MVPKVLSSFRQAVLEQTMLLPSDAIEQKSDKISFVIDDDAVGCHIGPHYIIGQEYAQVLIGLGFRSESKATDTSQRGCYALLVQI